MGEESKRLFDAASRVIPGGVNSPVRSWRAVGGSPAFIARGSAHDGKHSIKLKRLIKKAFEYQRDNTCFSFIEVLSTCPTNWGLSPTESDKWLEDTMMPYYPLGIFKEPGAGATGTTGTTGTVQ